MNKKGLIYPEQSRRIKKYFNQKEKLTLKNKNYFNQTKKIIVNYLQDDIGWSGDITSDTLIKENSKAKAVIITKQTGIIAGLEEIKWFVLDYGLRITNHKKDGEKIKKGDKILTITGNIKDILKIERTILNLLQRMSGIATETNKIVKLAGKKVLICSTRKTILGLLDKKAVTVGGGGTHRLGLYDWILVKDNHLKYSKSYLLNPKSFWEIEVETEKQAFEFAKLKPNAIMLDNFKPNKIKQIITKLKKQYPQIILEASGGINEKNIKEYSKTGIDIISLGYLTHSARALDLSLKIL